MPAMEVRSRERIHIRTRESGVTLSAWRTEFVAGAIVLLEVTGRPVYRGEGALLGASQEKLENLWLAALPPAEPPQDMPQLG